MKTVAFSIVSCSLLWINAICLSDDNSLSFQTITGASYALKSSTISFRRTIASSTVSFSFLWINVICLSDDNSLIFQTITGDSRKLNYVLKTSAISFRRRIVSSTVSFSFLSMSSINLYFVWSRIRKILRQLLFFTSLFSIFFYNSQR